MKFIGLNNLSRGIQPESGEQKLLATIPSCLLVGELCPWHWPTSSLSLFLATFQRGFCSLIPWYPPVSLGIIILYWSHSYYFSESSALPRFFSFTLCHFSSNQNFNSFIGTISIWVQRKNKSVHII